MDEQQKVSLAWHEIQTIVLLLGKDIQANPLMRKSREELFQKLYPLYESGPQFEFVIQTHAKKTEASNA